MGSRDLKIMDGINCGVQEATDFLKKKKTPQQLFFFYNVQLYTLF